MTSYTNKKIFDSGAGSLLLILGLVISVIIIADFRHSSQYTDNNADQDFSVMFSAISDESMPIKKPIERLSYINQNNFLSNFYSNKYLQRQSVEADEEKKPLIALRLLKNFLLSTETNHNKNHSSPLHP
ncbi:MAG: hypothetical protein ACFCUU_01505 [Cyclobacteriaceae bacterium]